MHSSGCQSRANNVFIIILPWKLEMTVYVKCMVLYLDEEFRSVVVR